MPDTVAMPVLQSSADAHTGWLCVTCGTPHYYAPAADTEGPSRHLALVRVWAPSCPVCGTHYHPRSRKRQYCSDACRYAARGERNKTNGYQQQYRARKRREREEAAR